MAISFVAGQFRFGRILPSAVLRAKGPTYNSLGQRPNLNLAFEQNAGRCSIGGKNAVF